MAAKNKTAKRGDHKRRRRRGGGKEAIEETSNNILLLLLPFFPRGRSNYSRRKMLRRPEEERLLGKNGRDIHSELFAKTLLIATGNEAILSQSKIAAAKYI